MAAESQTAVVAALAGNVALTALKGVAAAFTGSAAMLAETFHSAADTGNQVLLMLGLRLSRRPPDHAHPFGHGNNVYFWSFVVSMTLFTVGGAFAIREGLHRLRDPEETRSIAWAWGVLAGAFVFEAASLTIALRSLRAVLRGRGVLDYLHDTRDPTVATVVLEDSGALASILVAAGGLALSRLTGTPTWDGVASLVIGALLIGIAAFLALESYSLLLGERASPYVEARVRGAVEAHPAVAGILTLHTLHVGPEFLLVALHVAFRADVGDRLATAVQEVEGRVREALRGVADRSAVFVEPRVVEATARRAA